MSEEFGYHVAKTLVTLYEVQVDIMKKTMAIEKDAGKVKAILWGFVEYIEGQGRKPMGGDNHTFQQLRGVEEMINLHHDMLEKKGR